MVWILKNRDTNLSNKYRTLGFEKSDKKININQKKENRDGHIDIVVLGYNTSHFLEHQIRLIKKYISGDYSFYYFDCSSDDKELQKSYILCKDRGVGYLQLPRINLELDPSISNGINLNWIYYNFIDYKKNNYFCLIHPDMFPMTYCDIVSNISEKKLYGSVSLSKSQKEWFLSPHYSFFNYKYTEGRDINFLPCKSPIMVDTGGSNYFSLYKNIDYKNVESTSRDGYFSINNSSDISQMNGHCMIEDRTWLHIHNGSNWFEKSNNLIVNNDKKQRVINILEKL